MKESFEIGKENAYVYVIFSCNIVVDHLDLSTELCYNANTGSNPIVRGQKTTSVGPIGKQNQYNQVGQRHGDNMKETAWRK